MLDYCHTENELLPKIKRQKEKKTWATGDINDGSLLPEQRTNK